ncbi:hypothetical protein [Kordiimonas laminariae]|uniref:hypothetical protein n=1 Tax=Kordiimonas laminariae TaxID=2917717 RepID=UPI001FF51670|nr:hypothetical protein [Kordiimonas laminariae]MCK0070518.1 hypothetical protein [Kordiimonas laminariae]
MTNVNLENVGGYMNQLVNHDGLTRLVKLELNRLVPSSREEASRAMYGRVGAYDKSGAAIEAGINSYFSGRKIAN